jgi:hypothetical protein
MARPTSADRRYRVQRLQRETAESGALKRACPTCKAAMGQQCFGGLNGGAHEERKALAGRGR